MQVRRWKGSAARVGFSHVWAYKPGRLYLPNDKSPDTLTLTATTVPRHRTPESPAPM